MFFKVCQAQLEWGTKFKSKSFTGVEKELAGLAIIDRLLEDGGDV